MGQQYALTEAAYVVVRMCWEFEGVEVRYSGGRGAREGSSLGAGGRGEGWVGLIVR